MVVVRATEPSDRDPVLSVVRDAFSYGGDRDPQEEIDIVEKTWAANASPESLDLVADDDGSVVGHVIAARGRLAGVDTLGVAALAVSARRQGEGIGSALMTDTATWATIFDDDEH